MRIQVKNELDNYNKQCFDVINMNRENIGNIKLSIVCNVSYNKLKSTIKIIVSDIVAINRNEVQGTDLTILNFNEIIDTFPDSIDEDNYTMLTAYHYLPYLSDVIEANIAKILGANGVDVTDDTFSIIDGIEFK